MSRDEDTTDHFVGRSGLEDIIEVIQTDAVRLVQRLKHRLVEVDALVNLSILGQTGFILKHLQRLFLVKQFRSGL